MRPKEQKTKVKKRKNEVTSEEVLGLPDVHPESFEFKAVELAISGHEGENFLFNTRRLNLKVTMER